MLGRKGPPAGSSARVASVANGVTVELLEKAVGDSGSEYVADISQQKLASLLGPGFARFPLLRSIDASFNALTSTAGAAALLDLRELRIANNQVASLEGLSACKKLERLYLQDNRLESLAGLQDAKFLRILRVDGNQLSSLAGLEKCFSLVELDVSRNRLTALAPLKLRTLTTLRASRNAIARIGGGDLAACPALEELHLDGNVLTYVGGLAPLANLMMLQLDDNQLATLESLPPLPGLLDLSLARNKLASLVLGAPAAPAAAGSGASVVAASWKASFPSLEMLDVSGNAIAAPGAAAAASLPKAATPMPAALVPLATALLPLAGVPLAELSVHGNPFLAAAASRSAAADTMASLAETAAMFGFALPASAAPAVLPSAVDVATLALHLRSLFPSLDVLNGHELPPRVVDAPGAASAATASTGAKLSGSSTLSVADAPAFSTVITIVDDSAEGDEDDGVVDDDDDDASSPTPARRGVPAVAPAAAGSTARLAIRETPAAARTSGSIKPATAATASATAVAAGAGRGSRVGAGGWSIAGAGKIGVRHPSSAGARAAGRDASAAASVVVRSTVGDADATKAAPSRSLGGVAPMLMRPPSAIAKGRPLSAMGGTTATPGHRPGTAASASGGGGRLHASGSAVGAVSSLAVTDATTLLTTLAEVSDPAIAAAVKMASPEPTAAGGAAFATSPAKAAAHAVRSPGRPGSARPGTGSTAASRPGTAARGGAGASAGSGVPGTLRSMVSQADMEAETARLRELLAETKASIAGKLKAHTRAAVDRELLQLESIRFADVVARHTSGSALDVAAGSFTASAAGAVVPTPAASPLQPTSSSAWLTDATAATATMSMHNSAARRVGAAGASSHGDLHGDSFAGDSTLAGKPLRGLRQALSFAREKPDLSAAGVATVDTPAAGGPLPVEPLAATGSAVVARAAEPAPPVNRYAALYAALTAADPTAAPGATSPASTVAEARAPAAASAADIADGDDDTLDDDDDDDELAASVAALS